VNVELNYRYRDGANYHNNSCEVFSNAQSLPLQEIQGRIKTRLIDDLWFYVEKWRLKDLHFATWDNEIDVTWHEFVSVEETSEEVTKEDISVFLALIEDVQ
jgi:hypothetical protein